jgi:hypothetical protein
MTRQLPDAIAADTLYRSVSPLKAAAAAKILYPLWLNI